VAIQILQLRASISNPDKLIEKGFEKNWRASSVADLFENLEDHLESIPEKEHFNLFYTAADCFEERGRKLKEQWIIPFDIDKVDLTRIEQTYECVLKVLEVTKDQVVILCSGNGLQIIVPISEPITDEKYFSDNKGHYKAIADKINVSLKMNQLPGVADPTVFSKGRILRLPGTVNIKAGKEDRKSYLITKKMDKSIGFDIRKLSKLPDLAPSDHISQLVFSKWPKPDTMAVLEGCKFLNYMLENGEKITEPQWYAGLSILGNLENGEVLAHEYSKNHSDYTYQATHTKLNQAMSASGPRVCKNIDTLWDGCSSCPHHNKIVSPVAIHGDNFIKTKSTGFYDIKIDANGEPKRGKPNYTDLRKHFELEHTYITNNESKILYVYNGKFWERMPDLYFEAFAENSFDPRPDNRMCAEFVGAIKRNNLKDTEWFNDNVDRKINFLNGVLDIRTDAFVPHSEEFGFQYVLPYAYDKTAICPRWDKFLLEITGSNQEVIETLLEYAGYAISGDTCWAQKALMLIGGGGNGKSVFLNTLRSLAGESNVSSVPLGRVVRDVSAYQLVGALFNVSEETNVDDLSKSAAFKNLVTGGEVEVKYLYHQPYMIKNRAKLLFACNDFPNLTDTSDAIFRRLIIVPFDVQFGDKEDKRLDEKLKEELPGIFNTVFVAYKHLMARKRFKEGQWLIDAKEELRLENDTGDVNGWIESRIDKVEVENLNCAGTDINSLYADYREYAREAGEKEVSRKLFSTRFAKMIGNYKLRKGERVRTEKGRFFLIRGVQLRVQNRATH